MQLLKEDGAKFSGTYRELEDGQIRASYLVELERGAEHLEQTDMRVCKTLDEAKQWWGQEAGKRGFEKYGIYKEKDPT